MDKDQLINHSRALVFIVSKFITLETLDPTQIALVPSVSLSWDWQVVSRCCVRVKFSRLVEVELGPFAPAVPPELKRLLRPFVMHQ